ncbi:site-2 protease family protein [Erythrobacter sp. W53]|uniref:site-2 protease family protein n=1 Tax=Erythrobacter sp. W53 TaxID=3425947 RepID=UPI003D766D8E
MSDTLLLALVLIPCLIVAIVFHEVAHGWAALALGDPTAKERKRLSLNPLRHVDPVGTILVPGALALMSGPIFGWAKPVPVNKNRLDDPRFGMMAVAAAGPAMNFLLAAAGAIAIGILGLGEEVFLTDSAITGEAAPLAQGLFYFLLINIFLGIFNLLPIPPFDGSHIVEGLMPRRYVHLYEKIRPFGMILFVGLIAVTWFAPELGVLQNTIGPPVNWAMSKYISLAGLFSG